MLRLWTVLLGVIVALTCASGAAFASSGCTAVNAGSWNLSVTGGVVSITDVFDAGDRLTFSVAIGDPEFNSYAFSGSLAAGGSGPGQVSFTADSGPGTLTLRSNRPVQPEIQPRTISATGVCIAASAGTTTSLGASPNPAVVGQNVTFSATVSGGSPTGTVGFFDGEAQIGSSTLSGGVALYTTASLAVGNHSITARYPGGPGNDPSTSNVVTQIISPATTAVTVASSLNPSSVAQSVTFTATVTGASPTGVVTFLDGGAQIGSAILAGGSATFSTAGLGSGAHSITARYAGDANNGSSVSGAVVQTVGQAPTAIALGSSANPSEVGRAVTFSATVSGVQPVGSVAFLDGDSVIGEAIIANGVATLTTTALTVGAHAMSARFGGDANNLASTSSVLVQRVDAPADSIKLRALQVAGARLVSQISGDAISGALADAVGDGLAGPSGSVLADGGGFRFRFAPRPGEWSGWGGIRETGMDQDAAGGFEGRQTNLVAGLTHRVSQDLIIGVLAGYEDFGFEAVALSGRLDGEGWTVGGYAGWRAAPDLRIDAGFARSSLRYEAVAGEAAGSFRGVRWLVSGGLTGAFAWRGLEVEPGLRFFAVTESEDAYTDTLGIAQAAHGFGDAHARGGARVRHLMRWSASTTAESYVGLYGAYAFSIDTRGTAGPGLAGERQGWSATLTTGLRLSHETMLFDIGGEYGGIGDETERWTVRVRFGVPL